MKRIITLAAVLLLISTSFAYEGRRADSILLNGTWQCARGQGSENAQKISNQSQLTWHQAEIPGQFVEWSDENTTGIRFIWTKRKFDVTESQAHKMAVLRWKRINFGATAYINGQKIGFNEPTGPYQVIVKPGILKAGENEIVLKIPGAAGVRKGKEKGHFLIPSGFATNHKKGLPRITDDIWIDFAEDVYIKWVLAIADMKNKKVGIRLTPAGLKSIEDLTITAQVKPWPSGEIIGKGRTKASLTPDPDPLGGEHFFVVVPMPNFKPWTYEDRNLYTADVQIRKDGKILDELTLRFGMRELGVAGGNYKLNGKNLWLRGSNLVFEWEWGNITKGKEIDYLVTEAREMSFNSFRTHTLPPPRLWADICDEHGTMILAEFPVLFNGAHYGFTEDEWEIWHRNVMTDAAGWMARLWNHPSVIMWVLTNESPADDGDWEATTYHDFVVGLDPTRPTLRAGAAGTTGTPENFDLHTCYNTINPTEGRLIQNIPGWPRRAKGRPLTNTEYMNIFARPLCQWTGVYDKEADNLAYAQLGAEHTEAMRRARLDGIWPYMYAGWTKTRTRRQWKAGFAHPASAAWHSTQSAVLASLDIFNPDYTTAQRVTSDLYLINDSWHDADIHVDLLITEVCPEFIPEAECFDNSISKQSFDYTVKADSLTKVAVTWQVPATQGSYWLTARTAGAKDRPVLSQRFIRAIDPPQVPAAVKERTFVILGSDAACEKFFTSHKLRTSEELSALEPDKHFVLIWNADKTAAGIKDSAQLLSDFAAAGGRIAVLSTRSWGAKELVDVTCGRKTNFTRSFAYEDANHPMLDGIGADWLMRWNGLPGTVAVSRLEGGALEKAQKILWTREPKETVAAELPTAAGTGRILFCQLAIQDRVDPSQPQYDPVAERILMNILAQ